VVLQYRFSEFEIDLSQQELRRLGEAVPYEPQVFDSSFIWCATTTGLSARMSFIETSGTPDHLEAALSSRINGAVARLATTETTRP